MKLKNLAGNPEYEEVQDRLQGELKGWLAKWGDEDPVKTETGFVKPAGGKKK